MKAPAKAPAKAAAKRADDGAMSVGMDKSTEAMVRAALQGASLEHGYLVGGDEEEEELPEVSEGQHVEACYVGNYDEDGEWIDFDGEWYAATIDSWDEDGVTVLFDEYDEYLPSHRPATPHPGPNAEPSRLALNPQPSTLTPSPQPQP